MQTPPAPQVDGYTVGRLVGTGSTSQVWTALDARTGRTVALKVLTDDGGTEGPTRRRVDHPHVLRLLRTTTTADGRRVLVTDHAAGGSLAAQVAARGPLDPGEVVTLLTPLAGALADLHERGIVHGDVAPGNVLFLADGRPVLTDLGSSGVLGVDEAAHGTPGFVDPALSVGARVRPASDVHGLGALGWFALTGQVPEPAGSRPPLIPVAPETPAGLASVVERCLDPEPRRRPSAAEVAVQVYGTADAAPVRLVPLDPGADAAEVVTHRLRQAAAEAAPEAPASRRRRTLPLVVSGAALVVALVAGAAATGVLPGVDGLRPAPSSVGDVADARPPSVRPSDASPSPGPTTVMTPTFTPMPPMEVDVADPLAAVTDLSSARAQAFSTLDEAPLREANVAGSPALEADLATLADLRDQQIRLDGLAFEVADVVLVSQDGADAVVGLTVVTGAHRVVADDGTVLEEVAASAPARVELALQLVEDRWRVSEVR